MPGPKDKVFAKTPTDHSWEVFRDWIAEFYTAVTGEESDGSSISDEEWKQQAEEFWKRVDADTAVTNESGRSE